MSDMKIPSFDTLTELYQRDPKMFDEVRTRLINEHIERMPEERQQRAKQLQFQIDSKLNLKKNDTARLIEMQKMFYDGLFTFRDTLNGNISLNEVDDDAQSKQDNIVEFRKKDEVNE